MKKLQDKYEIKEEKLYKGRKDPFKGTAKFNKTMEKLSLEFLGGEKQLFFTEEEVLKILEDYLHSNSGNFWIDFEYPEVWFKKYLKTKNE